MSNSIVTRTIGTADKRLSLGNGQGARLLEYLTTWSKVRIGLRLSFNGAANITGTPQLFVGMCSDTANAYADVSTDNSVGISVVTSTWTYAGSPAYYGAIQGVARSRVGTTTTDSSTFGSSVYLPADVATNRSALIVEITKGSPFTVSAVHPSTTGGAQTDISDAQIVSMMEASTMTGAAAIVSGYGAQTPLNMTIDEAGDGYLNALNIFWDRSTVPLELSDVLHRRVS